LSPLTTQDEQILDRVAGPAKEQLKTLEHTLKTHLTHDKNDPALRAIDKRLKVVREEELPGCYDTDKGRLKDARIKQFIWALSTQKPVIDPQTGERGLSDREQHQLSAARLKGAYGSDQWLVPYDLSIALEMRALAMRQARFQQHQQAWVNKTPEGAEQHLSAVEQLDIVTQKPLIEAQRDFWCADKDDQKVSPENPYEKLCLALGKHELSPEQCEQMDTFDMAQRGRHRLLEKIRLANNHFAQLEKAYQLPPFTLDNRPAPMPVIRERAMSEQMPSALPKVRATF
jgi:hypothetical protein